MRKEKERFPVKKLHPELKGQNILFVEAYSHADLIIDRFKLEGMNCAFADSLAFRDATLADFVRNNNIDIVAIHSEVQPFWQKSIDEVWSAGIPIVIIKGSADVAENINEMYTRYENMGMQIVNRNTLLSNDYVSYENALMDAIDATLKSRKK